VIAPSGEQIELTLDEQSSWRSEAASERTPRAAASSSTDIRST
jgi:hypothetical protein